MPARRSALPLRVVLRRGEAGDALAVALFYRRTADREWPFLAPHTAAEDRAVFRDRVFGACVVWLAKADGELIGFCAVRRGWIDHLFVDHGRHGQGIGRALLTRAMRGRRHVRLWTFQRNARSRRFYRRNGWTEALFTDGGHNEEREPDVMMEWRALA